MMMKILTVLILLLTSASFASDTKRRTISASHIAKDLKKMLHETTNLNYYDHYVNLNRYLKADFILADKESMSNSWKAKFNENDQTMLFKYTSYFDKVVTAMYDKHNRKSTQASITEIYRISLMPGTTSHKKAKMLIDAYRKSKKHNKLIKHFDMNGPPKQHSDTAFNKKFPGTRPQTIPLPLKKK